jgi:hypothetical protein
VLQNRGVYQAGARFRSMSALRSERVYPKNLTLSTGRSERGAAVQLKVLDTTEPLLPPELLKPRGGRLQVFTKSPQSLRHVFPSKTYPKMSIAVVIHG